MPINIEYPVIAKMKRVVQLTRSIAVLIEVVYI